MPAERTENKPLGIVRLPGPVHYAAMLRTYRQIADTETVPDTVEVGISSDGMPTTEASQGEVSACVYWQDHVHQGEVVPADMSPPMPVIEALTYAETVRARHGFADVVVCIEDGTLWNPEWGELLPANDDDGALAKAPPSRSDVGRNFILLGIVAAGALVPAAFWLRGHVSRLMRRG